LLFQITGKHIDVPEGVKEHAEQKTSKLPRYYNSINQVDVIVDGDKAGNAIVEIIARAEHNKTFVVKESSENPYKSIDVGVHKLERQLRKIKGKERENKHAETS